MNDDPKRPENALEELVEGGQYCVLPSSMISALREREPSWKRKEREKRMIEHGDVDPDYFNR